MATLVSSDKQILGKMPQDLMNDENPTRAIGEFAYHLYYPMCALLETSTVAD